MLTPALLSSLPDSRLHAIADDAGQAYSVRVYALALIEFRQDQNPVLSRIMAEEAEQFTLAAI